ncbi:hypothetical protein AAFN85_05035 [Mucilaginibacter sp. CAU 1740]|uniref:hypothetical protein n=1 Tax=Mucilaginibacter sp. CAU 1740 TaxID=3140365 RepID=UPI00325BF99D
MDFSSLFSASDNLYKFLFVGGIVMICFSMVYPLQKKQELEIEINTYNKEAEFLNRDIEVLQAKIADCRGLKTTTMSNIRALKASKSNKKSLQVKEIDKRIDSIKRTFSQNVDNLEKDIQQVKVKDIILKYNKTKIRLLQDHSDTYDCYSIWLLISGVITGIIGLFFWSISTRNSEILKKEEIMKTRRTP